MNVTLNGFDIYIHETLASFNDANGKVKQKILKEQLKHPQ